MKNLNETVLELKPRLEECISAHTQKSRIKGKYNCPFCGSGTNKNKTGALSIQNDIWHCFACGKGGDIFDFIGDLYGLDDFMSRFKKACELFNISLDKIQKAPLETSYSDSLLKAKEQKAQAKEKETIAEKYTITMIQESAKCIEEAPHTRGISLETMKRYKIGYHDAWKTYKAELNNKKIPATPRFIIPTSEVSYVAVDARLNLSEEEKKYSKMKQGSAHFFNINALNETEKPIFIVEGEFDALSILDVGGVAISLGSVSMDKSFINYLKEHKPKSKLLLSCDNDERGKEANKDLHEALEALNIDHEVIDLYSPPYSVDAGDKIIKDANDLLQHDRKVLEMRVQNLNKIYAETKEKLKEKAIAEYKELSAAGQFGDFLEYIKEIKPCIKTGFSHLDEILGGGLYEGLYILGAISSLGKTTLALQIADNIARGGNDVLIFSLEMSKYELIAKSISRISHQIVESKSGAFRGNNKKTVRGVLNLHRRDFVDPVDQELMEQCYQVYSQYASNIFIFESLGTIGVNHIREAISKHESITGRAPFVLVDYLQILKPFDPHSTDKQNTDIAVSELKRISRDFHIPLLAISSLNRANYSTSISMEAFKESGAIEYSSDVLIGLQIEGIQDIKANEVREFIREQKAKAERNIQAVILKNRNGSTGECSFIYNTYFNSFDETLPKRGDDIAIVKEVGVSAPKKSKYNNYRVPTVKPNPIFKSREEAGYKLVSMIDGSDIIDDDNDADFLEQKEKKAKENLEKAQEALENKHKKKRG